MAATISPGVGRCPGSFRGNGVSFRLRAGKPARTRGSRRARPGRRRGRQGAQRAPETPPAPRWPRRGGRRGRHLGQGRAAAGARRTLARLPDLKVTVSERSGQEERTRPGSGPRAKARPQDGAAASAPALPAAAGALGGAGATEPGAEEPEHLPPRPLPRRGGAVAPGGGAAEAAEPARASCGPRRPVSPLPRPRPRPRPPGAAPSGVSREVAASRARLPVAPALLWRCLRAPGLGLCELAGRGWGSLPSPASWGRCCARERRAALASRHLATGGARVRSRPGREPPRSFLLPRERNRLWGSVPSSPQIIGCSLHWPNTRGRVVSWFSPKDMDENESNRSLMTSSQYPKEVVRRRQNSARNSGGSTSSRISRKSFKLDYRLEEDVTKSRRGKDGRFVNPWPTWKSPSIPNILRWLIMEKDHSSIPSSKEELDKELPVLKPYFINDPEAAGVSEAGLRVTWLGHASVMVEMDGLIFLTDPVFSSRASPSQYMGPKRFRQAPCSVSELPAIDAVLISHNHYDHLDYSSVISLNERFGNDLRWFVPLGLLDWMQKCGCENVIELDWWEENCVPGHDKVTFVLTPSQHWCKRTLWDDNKALWGSWSVLGPWTRFFFAGDTGYCPVFEEIGRRFGPFDLAALPIGAYAPRWFMKYQHVDPEEAVRIHIDVQAKKSVAIHWGTFALANEHYLEPPVKLNEALERYGLKDEDFFVLKHGESRYVHTSDESFE